MQFVIKILSSCGWTIDILLKARPGSVTAARIGGYSNHHKGHFGRLDLTANICAGIKVCCSRFLISLVENKLCCGKKIIEFKFDVSVNMVCRLL